MRLVEGCARGELGRACVVEGAWEKAEAHLKNATSILAQVSRWQALRFSLHLAAVKALRGELAEARRSFATLEAAAEIQNDAVLRELAALLYAAVELAEVRAAAPGSAESGQGRATVQRRLERAKGGPMEGASSDLRGWLRLLGRDLLER